MTDLLKKTQKPLDRQMKRRYGEDVPGSTIVLIYLGAIRNARNIEPDKLIL